jgi:Domain of Unknown Function (DUF1080)
MKPLLSLFRPALLALAFGAALSAAAADWRPLFNGRDFDGWGRWIGRPTEHMDIAGLKRDAAGKYLEPVGMDKDRWNVFSVVSLDGAPTIRISGEFWGALTTKESFSNYHLRAQIKWGEKRWAPRLTAPRDSGLLYHCFGPDGGADGDSWMMGMESQVQQGDFGDLWGVGAVACEMRARGTKKDQYQFNPTADFVFFKESSPAGRHGIKAFDAEKPYGEWNTIEIICVGDESIHIVNGKVVLRLKMLRQVQPDNSLVPLTAGRIQFQSEGAECYYRAIEIRPLTEIPVDYRE